MISLGRVIPGLAMAVLWVVLLLVAPPFFLWLVIVSLAALALSEYVTMTGLFPTPTQRAFFFFIALLPVLAAVTGETLAAAGGVFLSLLGLIVLLLRTYSRQENVLEALSLGSFAILYISFCLAHLVLLRFSPDGVYHLLLLTAITAGSDSGAYYCGRAFGREKLCPAISPGKTKAGAIGGMFCGAVAALVIAAFLLPQLSLIRVGFVAILLVVVGIVGDLTESIMKRAVGVKDSGTLLAGHGGILDRIDSLLLSGPLYFYLLFYGVVQ